MLGESLPIFLSHTAQNPHYHRRNGISLLCSEWEQVVLPHSFRQTNWKGRDHEAPALNRRLTVIYSHTAQNRTTIDVATFHFCVRNGNRWFCRAISVRQIG